MLGQITRRPADAVLAVQLGGKRPSSQLAVTALLEAPRRELAISIEAHLQEGMAHDVVYGAESVVGAADLTAHRGMKPVRLAGGGGDLQDPVSPDRADELARAVIGPRAHREEDPHPIGSTRVGDEPEESVGLPHELCVGDLCERTTGTRRLDVGGGDLNRGSRVDPERHWTRTEAVACSSGLSVLTASQRAML